MYFRNTLFKKAQLDKHNMQRWQLQDLLHAADAKLQVMNEGMPYSNKGAAPNMVSSTEVKRPRRETILNMANDTGLPAWIPEVVQKAIFRKIRYMTAGNDPLLVWKEPLKIMQHLRVDVHDSQTTGEEMARTEKSVLLRAVPTFQGVPSQDCIKVLITSEGEESSVYFAQCMAFVHDYNEEEFVVVRWFERLENHGFDHITHVPSFKLEQEHRTNSYCILPAYSILNGAVMVPGNDNRYWALLSPNEEQTYALQFRMH